MSPANGHYNGGGDGGDDRGNVTSIEEARRRAAEKAKAEKRAARGQPAGSVRDWIIGGVILAMALGYFASFFVEAPGLGGTGQ
jgi:hypothetical protein